MLSTNALAIAEIHKTIAMIITMLPPLIVPINSAISVRMPVCSKPPTETNKPMKNRSVLMEDKK